MENTDTPDFAAREREVLEYWKKERIFERSLEISETEHVFYDGPPFATGSPHHGTVFVSILKDSIARYFTMSGKRVPRRWGWDCHGLPIETAVEKELGITEKKRIEEYGVARFNDACRTLVMEYNDSWRVYIDEIGRWVDYDHPYRTLDRDYMESVLWVFGEAYGKGLIYRDYRVTPYCYRCETSLSLSDTRESDSTRPREDRTLTVGFRLTEDSARRLIGRASPCTSEPAGGVFLLAWTTTPWTLPANLALGVGRDLDYEFVRSGDRLLGAASAAMESLRAKLGLSDEGSFTVKGETLTGLSYGPLFDFADGTPGAFRVLEAGFVNTEEGTGIVHLAPAYGEDDYWTCKAAGVGFFGPVNEHGFYDETAKSLAGLHVHRDADRIIEAMEATGQVFGEEDYTHNYPHCWRCDTPLIYRAMDAWYFDVEKIKDRLIEENERIRWVPEGVKYGRFGRWLEGARDWNISRNRYWGTPIPVWECEDPACGKRWVAGSAAELEGKAGGPLPDLHKEYLDGIVFGCECGGEMRRVPEVLDCWFESGAMPFAQCHYPFENREWFETHFPADFIIEYPGQIRGWFYYLHVLAVALTGKPAFRNCVVHGTLLAEDGQKISKSKKNYTDPLEIVRTYGADALRLYLVGSPATAMTDMRFADSEVLEQVKGILLPIWNVYRFFRTYADIDGFRGDPDAVPDPSSDMDRWMMEVTARAVERTTRAFEAYELSGTVAPVSDLVGSLSRWYVRRGRARFWAPGSTADKHEGYETLYYVLTTLCRIMAPNAPFAAEWIYRELTGRDSVHLEPWPRPVVRRAEKGLVEGMETARKIVALGLSLRKRADIRVRQPLASLEVVLPPSVDGAWVVRFSDEITDELNVKRFAVADDYRSFAVIRAVPDARILGPRLGSEVQRLIRAAKAGNVEIDGESVIVRGDGTEWILSPEEISIGYRGIEGYDVAGDRGIVVALETEVDESLAEEGTANDLNRIIQNLRKKAGYLVTDRILLALSGPLGGDHRERIAAATLAEFADVDEPDIEEVVTAGGNEYRIAVAKAR